MSRLQLVERDLRELLSKDDTEAVVRWVKEQVLQSYRNGLEMKRAAGQDGRKFARRYAK